MINENLEQRTQGEDEKIPSKISGNCPGCKTLGSFEYIGRVDNKPNAPLYLYNCSGCHTTLSSYDLINKFGATFDPKNLITPYDFKEPESVSATKAQIRELFAAIK